MFKTLAVIVGASVGLCGFGSQASAGGSEPPSDQEVLRAFPVRSVPYVLEVHRDDVAMVKKRLAIQKITLPGLLGTSIRLEKTAWECVAHYTETIEGSYPFPFRRSKPKLQVVYVDKWNVTE